MSEVLPPKYLEARAEAVRFLDRLTELELAIVDLNRVTMKHWGIIGCPESAAVKRASMDLTRALAKLRKGGG